MPQMFTHLFTRQMRRSVLNPTLLSRLAVSRLAMSRLAFGTLLMGTLAVTTPLRAAAQTHKYGLGTPPSANMGSATRDTCSPRVIPLSPIDGARTLSNRPTFYWFVNALPREPVKGSRVGADEPAAEDMFVVRFILRDRNTSDSPRIYAAEGRFTKTGLQKFELPPDAPMLEAGKVHRWDLRITRLACDAQVISQAVVRLEKKPELTQSIEASQSQLAKARLYAKNGYWYDALNAYMNWMATNPKDGAARQELASLLVEGLQGYRDTYLQFIGEAEADIKNLNQQLEARRSDEEKLQKQSELSKRQGELEILRVDLNALEQLPKKVESFMAEQQDLKKLPETPSPIR